MTKKHREHKHSQTYCRISLYLIISIRFCQVLLQIRLLPYLD